MCHLRFNVRYEACGHRRDVHEVSRTHNCRAGDEKAAGQSVPGAWEDEDDDGPQAGEDGEMKILLLEGSCPRCLWTMHLVLVCVLALASVLGTQADVGRVCELAVR